jgi:undecaprenyl-phosphate 4-deoxy-4-formamido-L-arabinose transferase
MDVAGLSVVVPVYRSEESLPLLVDRLIAVLEARAAPFEILLVNDGSPDGSWEVIRRMATERPVVQGINLMRNYGQHNALLCGIRRARFGLVVTLDDDLQHPPEEIPKLLARLGEGYDVVYGTPEQEQHGLCRDLASQITKWALQSAMGAHIARKVSAFRALRTQLRDAFADYHGSNVSLDVLLSWSTTRFAAVPVQHAPRTLGVSNYTFRKLMIHALNMVTGFSTMPLRLGTLLGFAFTLFGIGVLIFVLARYMFEGSNIPGFPFLASIIAIFSGAQLFTLGMIGEYLGRMHYRIMDRPTYTVRSTTVQG